MGETRPKDRRLGTAGKRYGFGSRRKTCQTGVSPSGATKNYFTLYISRSAALALVVSINYEYSSDMSSYRA